MPELKSRALSRAEYDPATNVLTVWFAETGKAWDHFAVPAFLYEGLIASESPGRFYSAEIRNRYPTKRHRRLKSEMAA